MRLRLLLLAATASLPLGGCLGGMIGSKPEGVLPTEDIGPPPSMRGPAARAPDAKPPRRTAEAGRERAPLSVPGSGARAAGASGSERRFRREDLEDYSPSGSAGSSVAPVITPGGGAGIGGRF